MTTKSRLCAATSKSAFRCWPAWLCATIFIAAESTMVMAQENSADVATYHYDTWRTGWNAHETTLSPVAVRNGSFGELHSVSLDEQVDAQPLVLSGLDIDGRRSTVVYVVTEKNTIYAIDASSGAILRTRSLGTPVPQSMIGCGNNSEVVGITSTPVIDRNRGLLYVVTFTVENDKPDFRIRALDQSWRLVAINRSAWSQSSGARTLSI